LELSGPRVSLSPLGMPSIQAVQLVLTMLVALKESNGVVLVVLEPLVGSRLTMQKLLLFQPRVEREEPPLKRVACLL